MEDKAKSLLDKFHKGTASEQEHELLEKWFLGYRADDVSYVSDEELETSALRSWEAVAARTAPSPVKKLWRPLSIAASLLLIAGVSLFYFNRKPVQVAQTVYHNDIAPGKMGATLTLANGQKIRLSDAAKGELAKGAGVTISKSADGQVVYTASGDAVDPATSGDNVQNIRNVLRTGRGETYMVVLPDRSRVWLNAASSLIYNTNMNVSRHRVVSLEGEAYFEVAKDKARPFVVISGPQEVEVLGTHFNVSSYAEDGVVKTTLAEGSVQVESRGVKKVLRPDQQSVLAADRVIRVAEVDAQEALAWKNGYFQFNGETLESAMKKVARWYDAQVVYKKDALRSIPLGGTISKYGNVSQVLKKIELTGAVHFRVEDKIITVE